MPETEKKSGRPTRYTEKLLPRIAKMVEAGFTSDEYAETLGISVTTWYSWQAKHKKLRALLKDWKTFADKRVEDSLFLQALKGNTTAMIFWLKNRQPTQWRDRIELDEGDARGRYEVLLDEVRRLNSRPQDPAVTSGAQALREGDEQGSELRYNGKHQRH